jgi:hypothetical protein
MKHKYISKFSQKPKTRLGWWVFGLGLPLLFVGPILGFFASVIRPLLDSSVAELVGQISGIALIILIAADVITATVLGLIAIKKGERSWAVWLGLIPAILALLFFAFMLLGELIFPH